MEDYAPDYDDNHEQEDVSNCESCTTSIEDSKVIEYKGLFDDDLIKISESEAIFEVIGKNYFLSNLRDFGKDAYIQAIHKINWSKSVIMQARLECFNVFQLALLQFDYDDDIGGGSDDRYVKYAWYCDSKQGIQNIVANGFSHQEFGPYHGIHLFPLNTIAHRVQSCVDDNDGLKHVLLCRVLVDKSKQKDDDDDDDVDDVSSPSEYVVYNTKMNTHILPEYVVSFRIIPSSEGSSVSRLKLKKPISSPWLPFTTLISIISKFLPPSTMNLIYNNYKDFKKGRISRLEWIQRLRRLAGNDLLINTIKYRGVNN